MHRATSAVMSPAWFAFSEKRYPSMIPDPRGILHGAFQAAGPLPGLPQSLVLAVFSLPATLSFPYPGSKSSFYCLPKPLLMFITIYFLLFSPQTLETGNFISKGFCPVKNRCRSVSTACMSVLKIPLFSQGPAGQK